MSLASKTTHLRIAVGAAVLVGFFVFAEMLLRVGLSEKRVQQRINRASGMTVQFEGFSVGIFGGVDLKGVTATGPKGDSLSVQSVYAKPSILAGLRGRLRFDDIRVKGVRFVRMERAKDHEMVQLNTPVLGQQAVQERKQVASELRRITRFVRRIHVENAGVDWMKPNGRVRAQIEGMELRYEETASGVGKGEVSLQRGIWEEALAVDSAFAALDLKDDTLTVADFSAQCGGGKLTGRGSLRLDDESRFAFSLVASSVDLGTMSRELPSLRIAGKAEANFQMEGLLGAQQTWVGDGELTVSDGMFKGLALLQMLGQVLQVQELAQLTVKKARSKVRISQSKAFFDGLQIDAGDVQLSAPGEVDFKRSVRLHAQISLAEHMIKGKALQLFDKRLSTPDATGRRSLAFEVTGTLDKPKTDLLDKLVGDKLGDIVGGALGGVLDQFLGGLLKPRKPAKPEEKIEPLPEPKGGAGEEAGTKPR